MAGKIIMEVDQFDLTEMLEQALKGLNPTVHFREDMDEMREEARKAQGLALCQIRNRLRILLGPGAN